jgi:hypothetical protein
MACCFLFATLDSNTAGNEGGGDFGGTEEEDQGHFADQGKPPLDASLILYILFLHYCRFYKVHVFLFSFRWLVPPGVLLIHP